MKFDGRSATPYKHLMTANLLQKGWYFTSLT
jgi:hypothetical protein